MRPAGPTEQVKSHHASVTMTARQAARLRKGRAESKPGDYPDRSSEQDKRQRDARRRLEDMRMADELDI